MITIPIHLLKKSILPDEITKILLDLRAAGYSYNNIAEILNSNSILTKTFKIWTGNNVHQVIRNIRLKVSNA